MVKPLKRYRYKNISISVFPKDNALFPNIVISKGYKPRGSKEYLNTDLRMYANDMSALRGLIEEFEKDFPDMFDAKK